MKKILILGLFLLASTALAETMDGGCYKNESRPEDACWQSESTCLSAAYERVRTRAEEKCEGLQGTRGLYSVETTYENVAQPRLPLKEFSCTVILRFSCRP